MRRRVANPAPGAAIGYRQTRSWVVDLPEKTFAGGRVSVLCVPKKTRGFIPGSSGINNNDNNKQFTARQRERTKRSCGACCMRPHYRGMGRFRRFGSHPLLKPIGLALQLRKLGGARAPLHVSHDGLCPAPNAVFFDRARKDHDDVPRKMSLRHWAILLLGSLPTRPRQFRSSRRSTPPRWLLHLLSWGAGGSGHLPA